MAAVYSDLAGKVILVTGTQRALALQDEGLVELDIYKERWLIG
jgi:hypothetical protein